MSINLWHDEDDDLIRPGDLDPDDDGDHKVAYYSYDEAQEMFAGSGSSCEDCDEAMAELREENEALRNKLSNVYDYAGCAKGDLDLIQEYAT